MAGPDVEQRRLLDPAAVEGVAGSADGTGSRSGSWAASGVSPTRIVRRRSRAGVVGGSGDGETDTSACV